MKDGRPITLTIKNTSGVLNEDHDALTTKVTARREDKTVSTERRMVSNFCHCVGM